MGWFFGYLDFGGVKGVVEGFVFYDCMVGRGLGIFGLVWFWDGEFVLYGRVS